MQMSHRRKTAFASSAIVLASVLSSCGFDYATDRDYTPGVGANDRSTVVDVLSGHVVTDQVGRGVFIASLSNNSTEDAITLTGITSEQTDISAFAPIEITPSGLVNLADGSVDPIQVTDPGTEFGDVEAHAKDETEHDHASHEGHGHDDHGHEGHDHAEGDYSSHEDEAHAHDNEHAVGAYDADAIVVAGKWVRVKLQFSNKETSIINVPVVANCGYYANIPGIAAGPERCPSGNDELVSH